MLLAAIVVISNVGCFNSISTVSDNVVNRYNALLLILNEPIIIIIIIIGKRTGGLGNKRSNGDHPNYSIVEIGQNTEKCPGDLGRVAVTQTPVRNHRLTLV